MKAFKPTLNIAKESGPKPIESLLSFWVQNLYFKNED
jgi:hypothetical protein